MSSAFLVVLGASLFWGGKQWLHGDRGQTDLSVAGSTSVTEVISPLSVSAAEPLLTRANLVSAFDGQNTGIANRMPAAAGADFHLISYLPGIDGATETYAVWLLKDGLADVKRMGDLSPRSDGSWVADFTAGALSGIAEPDLYRTLVIMKERVGHDDKGQKIAEAKF